MQEAWLGLLNGLSRFEGRSSVRTWLFRILINRARSTGIRERRTTAVGDPTAAVDASRFDAAGNWAAPPQRWTDLVEDRLAAETKAAAVRAAMADLPVRQREIVTLRDVEGLSSAEVCGVLEITDYLEEALSRVDQRRFERHLAGCPHCTEYLAQMRATIAVAGRLTPDDLTPPMRAEFIVLYRSWQDDDSDS